MDHSNDNQTGQRPASSPTNFVGIIAVLAGAAAVGLLWWMNMGLTKRVGDLEEALANLQVYVTKHNHTRELADLSKQLQDTTEKLSKHLQALAAGQPGMPAPAPNASNPAEAPDAASQSMPASGEPQTAPVEPAPTQPSGNDNNELPPPMSSESEAGPMAGPAEAAPSPAEPAAMSKQTEAAPMPAQGEPEPTAKPAEAAPAPEPSAPSPVSKPAEAMPAAAKAAPVPMPSQAEPTPAAKPAKAVATSKPKTDGWVINIVSVGSEKSAKRELARLRKQGLEVESARAEVNGKTWYRIYLGGFASHDAAEGARPTLELMVGIHDTWVGRQP